MLQTKVKDFEPNFLRKIKRLINDDHLERAETSLKKALKINSLKPKFKSKMYSLLGEIHYIKGNYTSSKRFYMTSLKFNPVNEYTLFNIANYHLYEQQWEKALPYIEKNLKLNPGNIKYLNQYVWCLILKEEYEQASAIYKKMLTSNKMEPQGFIDIAMAYISKGNFDEARKTIFTALGKFPESYLIEDTMIEIEEIEYNYKLFRREIFFKRLNELENSSQIFKKGLRRLVEGMSIRGYFKFE
jgi:tetratricopeptide (TPR) repeat protein